MPYGMPWRDRGYRHRVMGGGEDPRHEPLGQDGGGCGTVGGGTCAVCENVEYSPIPSPTLDTLGFGWCPKATDLVGSVPTCEPM